MAFLYILESSAILGSHHDRRSPRNHYCEEIILVETSGMDAEEDRIESQMALFSTRASPVSIDDRNLNRHRTNDAHGRMAISKLDGSVVIIGLV